MTEQEFNLNMEKIRPKLIHFADGFRIGGAATAEDMVQEAVLKVWKLTISGSHVPRNIEAITMAILKNVCLDYLKLKKNHTEDLIPNLDRTTESSPLKSLEIKEKIEMLKITIQHLPAEQQIVIRLRDVMGYQMPEIAQILDTTEGNIRTMLSRARSKMKEKLLFM